MGAEAYTGARHTATMSNLASLLDAARSGRREYHGLARAEAPAPQAIFAAMDRGNFDASTGVELEDCMATEKMIMIKIKEDK